MRNKLPLHKCLFACISSEREGVLGQIPHCEEREADKETKGAAEVGDQGEKVDDQHLEEYSQCLIQGSMFKVQFERSV